MTQTSTSSHQKRMTIADTITQERRLCMYLTENKNFSMQGFMALIAETVATFWDMLSFGNYCFGLAVWEMIHPCRCDVFSPKFTVMTPIR